MSILQNTYQSVICKFQFKPNLDWYYLGGHGLASETEKSHKGKDLSKKVGEEAPAELFSVLILAIFDIGKQ